MPVIGSLRFCDVACRHVDCANIAFSKSSGLNTNPLLDSVGVRPLIDQYVYCLTTTFSFPLPEGDKLAPSTQKESRGLRGEELIPPNRPVPWTKDFSLLAMPEGRGASNACS